MDEEFDFPFDAEIFDDLDLYIAYQLQQELDFSVDHGSTPDLEDAGPLVEEYQPHWLNGDDEDYEDNPEGHAYDGEEADDEDASGYTQEEEEVDDEGDEYARHSPTPSDDSVLEFSPDASARNSPQPLLPGTKAYPISLLSSQESLLLQSPPEQSHSSRRVCPTFSCSICLDDHPEDDVALIPTCEHSFCRDCLRSYITNKVSEHRYPIFCPVCITLTDEQSPGIIDDSVIEDIWIPEKEFRIFEEMQLSSLSILLHCRQCKETMYVARDEFEENKVVVCPLPTCTHRWCTACQQPVPLGGPDHTCDTGTYTNLDRMVRENGWKFCPGCRAPIQKESGCNHMTCITPGCNVNFCYSCGDTIVRSALVKEIHAATTNHYGVNCRLFEDIPDVDVPP